MWNKIIKEVNLGRYAGPFEHIPYKNFIQLPVGLVPKAGGQTRLIFHLSYDFEESGNKSVNYYTLDHLCSVTYKDLDYAVREVLRILELIGDPNCPIWFGKSDIKSAFRILCTSPECWWTMIMMAKHPRTHQIFYFIDKCLPFGHSISCALFQKFLDALAFLLKFRTQCRAINNTALSNYLDDFLFAAIKRLICNTIIQLFLDLCGEIGVPVALDKTEWADTLMVFLGILLEGRRHLLAVPEEKRIRALNSLQGLLDRKRAMVRELQSISGLLNFLNRAIFPGRAFTRRMYAKFADTSLKQYHHVRLDGEFKKDCLVWVNFLQKKTLSRCRPFVDLNKKLDATHVGFYSDAAKGENLGIGAIFQNKFWLFAKWEAGYIRKFDPSIEYLELLGVCMGVFAWSSALRNLRIIVWCDNQSVVSMLNSTALSCKHCMILIRKLTLRSLQYNMRIFARWVSGKSNVRSDLLSCQKISKFKALSPQFNSPPTKLPEELWPASRIWEN